MQSDLLIPTFPNYRKAGTSQQHQQAYGVISSMHCDFYDGDESAVTLLTSLSLCALCVRSVSVAGGLTVKGMEGEGSEILRDDIIS